MAQRTDVLVIGGGPAGLAAAIAARKKGFQVTVADGAQPPIDKACGEGLMPKALQALRELGVSIGPKDGQIFSGIRFVEGTIAAEASFSGEVGVGVRRTVLHEKMIERAQECGAALWWNAPVTRLTEEGAMVGGVAVRAKWVIGADGMHSRVRRWCGLEPNSTPSIRFAQRRHYRVKPWADRVEIHWGREMQAYVTPLGKEEICVVLISRDPRMRFSAAAREFPALMDSLADAEVSSIERGAATTMCTLNRVYRANVALTGDASGSVDAITGEGLCLSFRHAIELANALERGALEDYQAAHRQLAKRPNATARLLLLLDRHALLRRRVLGGLAKDPELFGRMLTAHTKETSSAFLAGMGTRLSWRLLAA